MAKSAPRLSPEEVRSVVDLAWDAKMPFAAVMNRHGLTPGQIVPLMKRELTPNAYKIWFARSGMSRKSAPKSR